jgi:hypothetical protein
MKARHEFETDQAYQYYLRAYFAARAMQGILSNNTHGSYYERIANDSVKLADELINALNQTK